MKRTAKILTIGLLGGLLVSGCVSKNKLRRHMRVNAELKRDQKDLLDSAWGCRADTHQLLRRLRKADRRWAGAARLKQADNQRRSLLRLLGEQLQQGIEAKSITMRIHAAHIVLALHGHALFAHDRTTPTPAGRKLLTEVAQTLAAIGNHHFHISGYADEIVGNNAQVRERLTLAAARAGEVAVQLVAAGLPAGAISTTGLAEFHTGSQGRATAETHHRHGRIEIALLPAAIRELPAKPTGKAKR